MVPGNDPRGRSHGTIFLEMNPRLRPQGPKPGTKTWSQNLGPKPGTKTWDQNRELKFKTEEELHELRICQRTI